jgi:hypothetical protein
MVRTTHRSARLINYFSVERNPLLTIAGFFVLAFLLVSPLRNVGVIDDWTYAWSVEHFLSTGRLAILDWSAHYPIFQTLWGSAFVRVFGFSFGVLRISTIILAIIGCMALYLTLRELEFDRWRSLLGALVLAANPVFFVLSFSFMTDVPFLAMMNLAVLCYVTGVKRERYSLLWVGGLFAVAAFLSRQVGVVIPLVLAPCLLQRGGGWARFGKRLLPMLVSLVVIGLLWRWELKFFGRTSVMEKKMEALEYIFPFKLKSLLKDGFDSLVQVGFWVAPLLIAGITFKPKKWPLIIVAVAIAGALMARWYFGEIMLPFDASGTWNTDELGDARGLMPGTGYGRGPLPFITKSAQWITLLSCGVLITGLARSFVTPRSIRGAVRMLGDWIASHATIMVTLALLNIVLIHVLWFYYDRYYLVLLPSVIYVALKATVKTGFTKAVALLGISLLAVVSVASTWDMLRFDQFCWDTYNELRASGVPPRDIDAGYVINGWMLYAHPENLPPGADPKEDVPYVTGDEDLPFKISTSPSKNYQVVKEVSFRAPFWSVSNKLYVLHKQEATSDAK